MHEAKGRFGRVMTNLDSAERTAFLAAGLRSTRTARLVLRLVVAIGALTKLDRLREYGVLRLNRQRTKNRNALAANPWAWGP